MNQIKIITNDYYMKDDSLTDLMKGLQRSVNSFLREHKDAEILCVNIFPESRGTLGGIYAVIKYREDE